MRRSSSSGLALRYSFGICPWRGASAGIKSSIEAPGPYSGVCVSNVHDGLTSLELQVVGPGVSPRFSWIWINSIVLFTDDNENSFVQLTDAAPGSNAQRF